MWGVDEFFVSSLCALLYGFEMTVRSVCFWGTSSVLFYNVAGCGYGGIGETPTALLLLWVASCAVSTSLQAYSNPVGPGELKGRCTFKGAWFARAILCACTSCYGLVVLPRLEYQDFFTPTTAFVKLDWLRSMLTLSDPT